MLQRPYQALLWRRDTLLTAACAVFLWAGERVHCREPTGLEPASVVAESDGESHRANDRIDLGSLERYVRNGSTRGLLTFTKHLVRTGRLHELGDGNLAWTTMAIPGWRWETVNQRGERLVLAVDGPFVVAICQGKSIEMSICDLSDGTALPRGYAGSAKYFSQRGSSTQHVTAHSEQHFSRSSPELFKAFYYFAGPTREIVSHGSLPSSPVDLISR